MYDVISLFAGIGGIDLGFIQAGFNICWANELDHAACNTFRYNFGNNYLVEGDIHRVDESTIPHADVLAAGFPCQSYPEEKDIPKIQRESLYCKDLFVKTSG